MLEGLKKVIQTLHSKDIFEYIFLGFGLILTYLSSLYRYLLFHSIAELFSIIIAGGIFLIGWNSRKFVKNSFFTVLGVSFLFIGITDLLHTLSYEGMGVFTGYMSNLPTQLWIAARYLQAISFLFAIFVFNKNINAYYLLSIYSIIEIVLIILIFQGFFPVCRIDAFNRLTPFKIISEYIIDVIILISLGLLFRIRRKFNKKVFTFLIISFVFTIISELLFTYYISVVDLFNFMGHIFKIIAFYAMYKAIIETGLERPFQLMFKQLSDSEENYRNLIQNSIEGVWVIDNKGKTTLINPAMAQMLGYSVENMMGRSLFEFLSVNQKDKAEGLINRNTEEIYEDDNFIFAHNSGRNVYTSLKASPVYDDQGKFNGTIAFVSDITEQKLAQDKIADIAKFPLENPNPVLRVSRKYVLFANKTAERIFDIGEGSYIPAILKESVENCFEKGDNIEVEVTINNSTYSIFIAPIKGTGYVNIYGRNITARKNVEQQLEQFVSTVSHELRTPISVLIMSLDYLENHKDKVSQETFERLQLGIKKNVYLLRELVEDILTLSRIDEKKVNVEWEIYHPYEVLIEILELMKPIAQEKNISIDFSVDKDLFLYGDKKKVDQIYRILIDNAIKYSEKNSTIKINVIDNYIGEFNPNKEDGILIQFKDKGIGIEKEALAHIFERFFRSEKVTDIPGTGLGLSIAKELIKLHLGIIYVESEYGKGTTFSIFFPRTEDKT